MRRHNQVFTSDEDMATMDTKKQEMVMDKKSSHGVKLETKSPTSWTQIRTAQTYLTSYVYNIHI